MTSGTCWLASFLIKSIASYTTPLHSINSSSPSSYFLCFAFSSLENFETKFLVLHCHLQTVPRCITLSFSRNSSLRAAVHSYKFLSFVFFLFIFLVGRYLFKDPSNRFLKYLCRLLVNRYQVIGKQRVNNRR